MKKGLLGLAAGLLVSGAALAQEGAVDQATIDANGAYLKGYTLQGTYEDTVYCQWNTKNIKAHGTPVGGFEVPLDLKNEDGDLLWTEGYKPGQYAISWDDDKDALRIDFVNIMPNDGANYMDFTLTWSHWLEAQNEDATPFDSDGDTLAGPIFSYGLDAEGKTNPINITAEVMTDVDMVLRLDLGDGNGRISNRISPRNEVFAEADFGKYEFSFSDTVTQDGKDVNSVGFFSEAYAHDYHAVKNGRGDKTLPPLYGKNGPDFPVMLDPQQITKISMVIDDGTNGELDDSKTLWIKRIVLGDESKIGETHTPSWNTVEEPVANGKVAAPTVGVVKGGIKVSEEVVVYNAIGQVVAKGNGEIAVPAGVAFVKGANGGVAKVVIK